MMGAYAPEWGDLPAQAGGAVRPGPAATQARLNAAAATAAEIRVTSVITMRDVPALLVACALLTAVGCKQDGAPVPAPPVPAPSAAPPATSASAAAATPSLGRGDKAPDFSLEGSDGKTHTLAEHAGKDVVVVAWFPKAFTGG